MGRAGAQHARGIGSLPPDTHGMIKALPKHLDCHHPARALLAPDPPHGARALGERMHWFRATCATERIAQPDTKAMGRNPM